MNILYLSKSKLKHSVNAVYIKGLEQNGIDVIGFCSSRKGIEGYFDAVKFLRKKRKSASNIIVGYDSPGFVMLAKMVGRKRVIYNALCSVYERLVVSRELARPFSPKAFYYWLLDFLAVHSADLVMVETNNQAEYFKKLFWVKEKKLFRAWTGVDEDIFYHNAYTEKFPVFTVIFRGQFLPESGVEYAIKAAKILENENINFIIHGGGYRTAEIKKLIEELKPKNLSLMTDLLSSDELRTLMQKCRLSLGQLSAHPRLDRTIPHKCYESLAMKLPYLTAANKGVLELLKDGETCVICEPANVESLAEKILRAKNNRQELERIAENGHQLHKNDLRSKILAQKLLANTNLL